MAKTKKVIINVRQTKKAKAKQQRKSARQAEGAFHRPTKKIKPKKGKGSYRRKKEKERLKQETKKRK